MRPRGRELFDGGSVPCHHQDWHRPAGKQDRQGQRPDVTPTEMTSPIAKLSFWGVRGSPPTVDPATWRSGGNPPCVEMIAPDGTQFVLDCGTGLRMLGSRWGSADEVN